MAFFNKDKYLSLKESLEETHTNRLVQIFEQTLRQSMARIPPLVESMDRLQIKKIAHQVYSSSALLGFEDFADHCRRIEYNGGDLTDDLYESECAAWMNEADGVIRKLGELQTGSVSLSL